MVKMMLGTGLVILALAGTATVGAAAPMPAPPSIVPGAKAAADPAVAIHKALQALYDAQDAALSRRDVPQAMAAYAPGYAAVGQDGTRHTRDEEFDALERVCAMGRDLRQHSRIEKIITHNGQASLVLHQQTLMDLFSPNTHQSLVLHTEGVSQDLWVHTSQGWRLIFSKTVLQRSSTGTGTALGAEDAAPVAHQAAARPRRISSPDSPTPRTPKTNPAL